MAKDDYISRKRAIMIFREAHGCVGCIGEGIESLCESCYVKEAEKLLNEVPADDVRPVVHGHWIGKEEAEKIFEENYSDYPYGQCSVCGHCDWDNTESEDFNFCPNCGADMKGGANGE